MREVTIRQLRESVEDSLSELPFILTVDGMPRAMVVQIGNHSKPELLHTRQTGNQATKAKHDGNQSGGELTELPFSKYRQAHKKLYV